ncbi:hypothetical protein Esti_002325 [Eimeria stiedai]
MTGLYPSHGLSREALGASPHHATAVALSGTLGGVMSGAHDYNSRLNEVALTGLVPYVDARCCTISSSVHHSLSALGKVSLFYHSPFPFFFRSSTMMNECVPRLADAFLLAEQLPPARRDPGTEPAAHSSVTNERHYGLNHQPIGAHEVLEALASAMNRLTVSTQASQQPSLTPVCPTSASSASLYYASLRWFKYHTYDGSRSQDKWTAASTDTQKLTYRLSQIGSARSYFTQLRHVRMRSLPVPDSLLFNIVSVNVKPHCRAALTRLQQLRSSDDLPLNEVEEACIQEDEAEFSRASFSKPGSFSQEQYQVQQQPQAHTNFQLSNLWRCTYVECPKKKRSGCPACGASCASIRTYSESFSLNQRSVLVANKDGPTSARNVKISSVSAMSITQPRVDKLGALAGPIVSAEVIKTNSLINSPKQLFFEGTVKKHPRTFLLHGGADQSTMSKNFALTDGITMHPLDPPISVTIRQQQL